MGRDKALIEVGGVACIARVASALAAAGCEPIRIAVAQPEDVERYGGVMPDGLDVEDSFKEGKLSMGIVFDGDGDRIAAIDEKGRYCKERETRIIRR